MYKTTSNRDDLKERFEFPADESEESESEEEKESENETQ